MVVPKGGEDGFTGRVGKVLGLLRRLSWSQKCQRLHAVQGARGALSLLSKSGYPILDPPIPVVVLLPLRFATVSEVVVWCVVLYSILL